MRIRILKFKDITRALDMGELIEGMKLTFQQLSSDQDVKSHSGNGSIFLIQRRLPGDACYPSRPKIIDAKMVSVLGNNPEL